MTEAAPRSGSWTPPLEAAALGAVLDGLRSWTPLHSDLVLADVAAALDDVAPRGDDAAKTQQRLSGWLHQLTGVAVSTGVSRRSPYVGVLVQRARAVLGQDPIREPELMESGLRHAGWVTHELLEQLVCRGCVKEEQ